jgi:glutamyl-tRNA synthetase
VVPPDFQAEEWAGPGANGAAGPAGVTDEAIRAEAPRLGAIIHAMGNRLRSVTEAPQRLAYFYKNDYHKNEEALKKHLVAENVSSRLKALAEAVAAVEPFHRTEIETAVRNLADTLGVKTGELIHPCRVALTGDDVSPDIFAVIHLLGRKKCVERLQAAAEYSSS